MEFDRNAMKLEDIIHIPVDALRVLVHQQGIDAVLEDLAIVMREEGEPDKADLIYALAYSWPCP